MKEFNSTVFNPPSKKIRPKKNSAWSSNGLEGRSGLPNAEHLPLVLPNLAWNLPPRLVLAPEEAGEELLLVSPARDVRLEWKVGRFNLLAEERATLG